MAGGRPQMVINWDQVDILLTKGCSGAEVAGMMGINPITLYRHCETDKGVPFSEYCQEFYSKGIASIKAHQYDKALGITDKGDNTLLIWLGKVRCGQKEEKNINISTDEQVPKWLQNHLNTSKDLVQGNDSKPE